MSAPIELIEADAVDAPMTPPEAVERSHVGSGGRHWGAGAEGRGGGGGRGGFEVSCEGWLRQCSKHLSHIEKRLMENEYLGHEVVRQISQVIEAFCPAPYGDWGWFMRQSQDIAVRTLRQLVRIYHRSNEEMSVFLQRAVELVRLYIEESFVRCMRHAEDAMRKRALCSLMLTMKSFEAGTFPEEQHAMGIFVTFDEIGVRAMASQVETATLRMLPSFANVMRSADMRVEAFSLMRIRPRPAHIALSKAEVRQLIEDRGHEGVEDVELPGAEGPGRFADLFPIED